MYNTLVLFTRNGACGSMYPTRGGVFATYREAEKNQQTTEKQITTQKTRKLNERPTTGNLDEKQDNHPLTVLALFTRNRLPTYGSMYLTRVDVFATYREGRKNPTNNTIANNHLDDRKSKRQGSK